MTARRLLALLLALVLSIALVSPLLAADAAPAKAKKKKKKAYDYEQSKYKAYKELVADDTHSYRFDERGNPIPVGGKKRKTSSKKKKKAEDEAAACSAGEACQDEAPASEAADDGTGAEAKASVQPAD